MPTKISNTNTNINKININVPRRYTPRPTKKNVAKAEQDLQSLETQDREIPYVSQAPSQFINPSVFGFNTTPIQEPVRPQTISRGTQTEQTQTDEEFATSPRVAVAEPVDTSNFRSQRGDTPRSPMPFRSSSIPEERNVLSLGYSEPQYKLNIPSDFPARLSQAGGSSFPRSGSAFTMPIYANRMRDIQKQGRPDSDINEMALKVKEAYRGEEQTVPYAKTGGTPFEDQPLEVALPPAKKKGGGRPVGSKNKPKGEEAPKKARKVKQIIEVGNEGAFATAGGGLRGQRAEEID
jgi:hypothetical protein